MEAERGARAALATYLQIDAVLDVPVTYEGYAVPATAACEQFFQGQRDDQHRNTIVAFFR